MLGNDWEVILIIVRIIGRNPFRHLIRSRNAYIRNASPYFFKIVLISTTKLNAKVHT
jgi:hypothetical protein